jgi:hypothetical protein
VIDMMLNLAIFVYIGAIIVSLNECWNQSYGFIFMVMLIIMK